MGYQVPFTCELIQANILVSDDGTLQLTDFGLTIMHDTTIRFSKNANQAGGTLRWMVSRLSPIYLSNLTRLLLKKAPELVLEYETGDGSIFQSSQSLYESFTESKDNEDNSRPKLCRETDIYALGMVSVLGRNLI